MPKIDEVFARLKKNKLAIPALVVGGGIGLFVLLKNGGQSGFGGGLTEADDIQPPDDGLVGGIGGGETDLGGIQSQIDDIASNQGDISSSFTDAINQISNWFTGALGEQQSYIDNQLEGLANSIPDFGDYPTGSQELGFNDSFLGDFIESIQGFTSTAIPENFSFSPDLPIDNIVPNSVQKLGGSVQPKQYVQQPQSFGLLRGTGAQAQNQNLAASTTKTKSVLPRFTEPVTRIINKVVKVPQGISQQPVYRQPKNDLGSGGGSRGFTKMPVYRKPTVVSKQPVYRKPTVVSKQPVYRKPTVVSKQPVYRKPATKTRTVKTR